MVKEVLGQFPLSKVLKDKRKAPKEWEVPTDRDILMFDQHREKLPSGHVKEQLGQAKGIIKKTWVDNDYLYFNWVPTDQNLINLVDNSKFPEKLFKYSPEHFPKNKTPDYPQGEIGVLDAMAITNLPNAEDAKTVRVFNSFIDSLFKRDEEDPLILNNKSENGGIMENEKEFKELIQNTIKQEDTIEIIQNSVKDVVTEVVNEKVKVLDELEQNIQKLDFEKIQKNLEKLNSLDLDKVETIQNMDLSKLEDVTKELKDIKDVLNEPKDKLVLNIMEVTDEYEKEELEQFSISTLEKIGKLNGIKINKFDGVGGEIVTNTQETAEESFERRFGRKAE